MRRRQEAVAFCEVQVVLRQSPCMAPRPSPHSV
ncbi:TPA: hypothetical protein N0F65_004575 [Lagenidium giganteum]|uniref:Uncharacterized protein n=1 Tax=Lagenidium giganteum TaxID=4803 RepID=A0AAV2ZD31_9STRA|nr:TPA: hypothetical protein N0F65_004575 [Lagenidium giganteum]